MKNSTLTKSGITRRLIIYQLIGFGVLMFLIVGDEVFDFPHTVFGAPATPINRFEAFIEGAYVLVLSAFTAYLSMRLLTRVKYLEGFLPICAHCKKIRVDDAWTPLEEFISTHSAAELSHGLCPECSEKHYGDYLRGVKNTSSTAG
jgi:hypothetical protein